MSTKLQVHCPHCNAIFDARLLPARRKYRNKYGIDVFTCPECDEPIKIEPAEYMFARQQIDSGESPEDAAIGAVPEKEQLQSEQAAIDHGKRGCMPVIALVGIGIGLVLYSL